MTAGITASSNFSITPRQISGLAFWFDGQDPNGNGSLPSDGASVATWVDKSGNGVNITQGVGSQQGTYQLNAINGRAAMLFSNSAQKYYKSANTTLFNALNSYNLFAVTRFNSTANDNVVMYAYNPSGYGIYVDPSISTTNTTYLQHIVSSGQDVTATGTNSWTTNTNYFMEFSRDGGAASIQSISISNGASGSLNPLVQGALPSDNKIISIPTNGLGPTNTTLNGYVGEEYFYTKAVNATERNILSNYKKLKWGI